MPSRKRPRSPSPSSTSTSSHVSASHNRNSSISPPPAYAVDGGAVTDSDIDIDGDELGVEGAGHDANGFVHGRMEEPPKRKRRKLREKMGEMGLGPGVTATGGSNASGQGSIFNQPYSVPPNGATTTPTAPVFPLSSFTPYNAQASTSYHPAQPHPSLPFGSNTSQPTFGFSSGYPLASPPPSTSPDSLNIQEIPFPSTPYPFASAPGSSSTPGYPFASSSNTSQTSFPVTNQYQSSASSSTYPFLPPEELKKFVYPKTVVHPDGEGSSPDEADDLGTKEDVEKERFRRRYETGYWNKVGAGKQRKRDTVDGDATAEDDAGRFQVLDDEDDVMMSMGMDTDDATPKAKTRFDIGRRGRGPRSYELGGNRTVVTSLSDSEDEDADNQQMLDGGGIIDLGNGDDIIDITDLPTSSFSTSPGESMTNPNGTYAQPGLKGFTISPSLLSRLNSLSDQQKRDLGNRYGYGKIGVKDAGDGRKLVLYRPVGVAGGGFGVDEADVDLDGLEGWEDAGGRFEVVGDEDVTMGGRGDGGMEVENDGVDGGEGMDID